MTQIETTMADRPLTVASIVRHARAVHGHAEIVTARTGEEARVVSFAETIRRAGRLAGGLRELGVRPGDRVATFLWNNQEHLEAYLAVPGLGAVLHTLNIRLGSQEISAIAEHAGDSAIIVDSSLIAKVAPVLADVPGIRTVIVTGGGNYSALESAGRRLLRYDDVVESGPDLDWQQEQPETAAAVMCYTSGTTGMPKGVVYSHRSTVLHAMSVSSGNAVGMSSTDRALLLVPMFHANAWGWPYAALMAGARVVLTDGNLSPAHVAEVISTHRITVTGGVPTLWNDLLNYLDTAPATDLSSLRLVLCGGSAVPKLLVEAYRDRFGVPIVQAWGMTEVSPLGAVARPPADASADEAVDYQQTQGRFLFGVEARIADDDGALLPSDGSSIGELQVRGPWVTGSYYQGTGSATFTADGWMRTGDVGTLDPGGYLRITDRSKDVIKSGGEWLSSVLLENRLTEHPEVAEVAVIGVPDPRWQERPLAIVASKSGRPLDPVPLRAWLGEQVARWWVPERWAFVDQVPHTSTGKIDKKLLREQYAADLLTVVYVDRA